ncbi:PAS fold-containing protein [Ekhidna lutea]|uniref:PAS fold-containing protein n=1 Tax=Ekhidna lutea TaxID=447679 RepID=A0A239LLC7_EKHLU|nr:LuxR C-terminal-related transcriptional regulator [Ekhidna lutea]SNT31477.1 PAS fold-containing protein [Ekhidna lutea]
MGYESKNIAIDDLKGVFEPSANSEEQVVRDYFSVESQGPTYEVGKDQFHINKRVRRIVGYSTSELKSLDDLYALIHPNDLDFALDFSIKAISFSNRKIDDLFTCRTQSVFRMKGKGGNYRLVNRESLISGAKDGKITRNVTYLNDISWMKGVKSGSWKVEGDHAELFDYKYSEIEGFSDVLTSREAEILRLLARGFHSRDIAEALQISRLTVDTHRRNMLRKVDVANTPELLTLARDMNLF